jgi:hypothetical protein
VFPSSGKWIFVPTLGSTPGSQVPAGSCTYFIPLPVGAPLTIAKFALEVVGASGTGVYTVGVYPAGADFMPTAATGGGPKYTLGTVDNSLQQISVVTVTTPPTLTVGMWWGAVGAPAGTVNLRVVQTLSNYPYIYDVSTSPNMGGNIVCYRQSGTSGLPTTVAINGTNTFAPRLALLPA